MTADTSPVSQFYHFSVRRAWTHQSVSSRAKSGTDHGCPVLDSERSLVETDARYASYKNWLGSDYMLQQLSLDPTVTQKRMGDGFYEQKLLREQVAYS